MECNCTEKLNHLHDTGIHLPLMEFKLREQIDIPGKCPVHSINDKYLTKAGAKIYEAINTVPEIAKEHRRKRRVVKLALG